MDYLTLIGTALALAMDAFAVSIAVAISLNSHTWRHTFRLSWHFGLFQGLMPIAGWLIGEAVVSHIGSLGNWLACAILCLLGGKMIWESFHEEEMARVRSVICFSNSPASNPNPFSFGRRYSTVPAPARLLIAG